MSEAVIRPTAESEPERGISNEDRKREKLVREVNRAHEWRVQVWAQMELKIRVANASLKALGGQPIEPWQPDFQSDDALSHYSTMKLSK